MPYTQVDERDPASGFAELLSDMATGRIVLAIAIALTTVGWYVSADAARQRAEERFRFEVAQTRHAIEQRMLTYEQMLRGGAGLFRVTQNVSRAAWSAYVSALQIDKDWPGIQGVGFARWVPPGERHALTAQVRAEGFPEFSIHPDGVRDAYAAVVYLEPFSGRNLRAFGFDMYSEPVRRAALERARDSGEAAVSGRVTLVQETGRDVQPGFLMVVPVYHGGMPVVTVDERRAALLGFVYSPFRMNDLMRGILGSRETALDLRVFDGPDASIDHLLFDTTPDAGAAARPARFATSVTLDLPGQVWTVQFRSTAAFDAATASARPGLIALGGIVANLVLFAMIAVLGRGRRALHDQLAAAQISLATSDARFRGVVESAPVALLMVDEAGRIAQSNALAAAMFGYSADELRGRPVEILLPERFRDAHGALRAGYMRTPVTRGMGQGRELYARRKNGDEFPVEIGLAAIVTPDGTGILVSAIDITAHREVEDRVRRERLYLRAVIDALDDGIAIADEHGRLVVFNEALRAMHGIGAQPVPKDLWARHYGVFAADGVTPVPPDELPLVRALRGEIVQDIEQVVAPEGLARRRVRVSARPITLATGTSAGAVAVVHDTSPSASPAPTPPKTRVSPYP